MHVMTARSLARCDDCGLPTDSYLVIAGLITRHDHPTSLWRADGNAHTPNKKTKNEKKVEKVRRKECNSICDAFEALKKRNEEYCCVVVCMRTNCRSDTRHVRISDTALYCVGREKITE